MKTNNNLVLVLALAVLLSLFSLAGVVQATPFGGNAPSLEDLAIKDCAPRWGIKPKVCKQLQERCVIKFEIPMMFVGRSKCRRLGFKADGGCQVSFVVSFLVEALS